MNIWPVTIQYGDTLWSWRDAVTEGSEIIAFTAWTLVCAMEMDQLWGTLGPIRKIKSSLEL